MTQDRDLPVPVEGSPDAGRTVLLRDLSVNLWASLKQTLDMDKVAVSALWLANLGGFGLIWGAAAAENPAPVAATVGALGVVNFFLLRMFDASREEVRRLVSLLSDVYTDHGLGQYFDQLREDYYVRRYDLRRKLCISLFVVAIALGFAFGLG